MILTASGSRAQGYEELVRPLVRASGLLGVGAPGHSGT